MSTGLTEVKDQVLPDIPISWRQIRPASRTTDLPVGIEQAGMQCRPVCSGALVQAHRPRAEVTGEQEREVMQTQTEIPALPCMPPSPRCLFRRSGAWSGE